MSDYYLPDPTCARQGEEPAYRERNTTGLINYGSYQVQAGVGLVEAAQAILYKHLNELPPLPQVKMLAGMLMYASDHVQASIRDDGHVDRMANSHTRARGAVRTVIDMMPPPFGADADTRAEWLAQVIERATQIIRLGVQVAYTDFPVVSARVVEVDDEDPWAEHDEPERPAADATDEAADRTGAALLPTAEPAVAG